MGERSRGVIAVMFALCWIGSTGENTDNYCCVIIPTNQSNELSVCQEIQEHLMADGTLLTNYSVIKMNISLMCGTFTDHSVRIGMFDSCNLTDNIYSAQTRTTTLSSITSTYLNNSVTSLMSTLRVYYVNTSELCEIKTEITYWQQQLADSMGRYTLRIICVLGIPGNILALVIITRMKPMTSSFLHIGVLAISDTTVLIVMLVYFEMTTAKLQLSDISCKLIYFLRSAFAMFSNWVIVLMACERVTAVWLPLKVNFIYTKKRTMCSIIVTWFLIMGMNSFYLPATKSTGSGCWFRDEYVEFSNGVWVWMEAIVTSAIPSVLLVGCNIFIIVGLRKALKFQKQIANEKHPKAASRQQRQITIMLLTVCIVFVVLTAPLAVFFIARRYWEYKGSDFETARYNLTRQFGYLLYDLSFSINFYLYFLTGRKFRNQLIKYMCRCRFGNESDSDSSVCPRGNEVNAIVLKDVAGQR